MRSAQTDHPAAGAAGLPSQGPPDALVATVLALLLGLQPVTTDLYLPTLPDLSEEFGGAMAAAQMTLSGLYVAFGLGQLLMGPLSDRFGRRPVLLGGLGLYVGATLLSMAAPSIEALVTAAPTTFTSAFSAPGEVP